MQNCFYFQQGFSRFTRTYSSQSQTMSDWRNFPTVVVPSKQPKQKIIVVKPPSSDQNNNHDKENNHDQKTDHQSLHDHTHDQLDIDDNQQENNCNSNNDNKSIDSNSSTDDNKSDEDELEQPQQDLSDEEEEEEDDDDDEEDDDSDDSSESDDNDNDNDDDNINHSIHDENDNLNEPESKQTEKEQRRLARKAKHKAKIKEVYGDYIEDQQANNLQTVPYRAPRKTHGCPHWWIGCKFQGDESALNKHIDLCPFEKMKAMIKKRDHQINGLQNSCSQLQDQVNQLHSLLSSFVSLQTPQLQNYLMSQLPNVSPNNGKYAQHNISLNRNISSELYDAPHTSINLSLHSLDDTTRNIAYDRRRMNTESIKKHKDSIKGQLGLIWETTERFIGDEDCGNLNMNGMNGINGHSSLLNPTVNFINDSVTHHRLGDNGNILTLPYKSPPKMNEINGKNGQQHLNGHTSRRNKDIAIRSLILFWDKIVSTSDLGIQIWNIRTDQDDEEKQEEQDKSYPAVYRDLPIFGQHMNNYNNHRKNTNNNKSAKIRALEHNTWLCNESSFGLATQPFSHPYWLFTGHKQQIKVPSNIQCLSLSPYLYLQ